MQEFAIDKENINGYIGWKQAEFSYVTYRTYQKARTSICGLHTGLSAAYRLAGTVPSEQITVTE